MSLADTLANQLEHEGRLSFGELILSRNPLGIFSAHHREDAETATGLETVDSVPALREIAKYDASGEFRPLKTAPGLRSGWRTETSCPREFLRRLDAIYPGLFATWAAYHRGDLEPVPLRGTLGRQTGMYRFAGTITDDMALRLRAELCAPGCLRCIIWPIDASAEGDSRFEAPDGEIPLLCTEACTFAVSRARELAKEAYDQANSAAPAQG